MATKKRRSKNKISATLVVYWILAGILVNGVILNRDKEIGIGTISLGFAFGGVALPALTAAKFWVYLDENVRIRIKK